MKIEIEISENDIRNHVESYINNELRQRTYSNTLKNLINSKTKEALTRAFEEMNFGPLIADECEKIAIKEIEKMAAKKVPGWVAQQMKEMLKYARAKFWELPKGEE
jgi:hypothetical protein